MTAADTTTDSPTASENPIQDIYDAVSEAIQNRRQYEERLRVCWDVRHHGISRKRERNWQSNTPLKIADPAIDVIKPQLVQGIFTADTIATFTSMDAGLPNEFAKLASQFFSDHVKRQTNFFRQYVIVTDMELQDGKAIFKTIWNPDKQQLEFHAIQSIYLIVPTDTEELEDAPWVCQVHRESVRSYKKLAKAKGWPMDDEFIGTLKGQNKSSVTARYVDDKMRREGLHYSGNPNEIIIWEVYERNDEDELTVTFFSPNNIEQPLAAAEPFPYKHGELPYVDFGAELKDKDYHSPRGVVEKILPEERIATQYRNYISDHAAFSARPMFTTNGTPIGNTNNLSADPGKVFPGVDLKPITMADPPEVLAEEMNNARQQGERLGGAGDYALSQNQPSGKPRTATEIGVVAQQSSVGMDLRSRLNRDSLTRVLNQGWRLIVQYKPTSLKYFFNQEMGTLPAEALADAYLIQPSGNPDGYSRAFETAQVMQVVQQCKGDPAYDQDELKKLALEVIDPMLVKRLFIGTQVAQKREAEDQAFDVLLLREGFPTSINPGEDQAARAMITAQYLQRVVLEHEPTPQRGMAMLQQHILARVAVLQQQNPPAAAQLKAQLKQLQAQTIAMVKQQEAQAAAAAGPQGIPPVPVGAPVAAPAGMPMPPPRGIAPAGFVPGGQP